MLATSFTCPECGTLLKLATPVPAGKKIKCPKCTGIFAMPESGSRGSGSVSPYDDAAPPSTRTARDEPDYPPARDASPHIRPYSEHPADYGRDDLERPRRERSIARAPQKSQAGLTIALIMGGLVLALGVFAIAAWVWPGFWKKGTPLQGEGTQELWIHVPRDCNLFVGVDLTVREQIAERARKFHEWLKEGLSQIPNFPTAARELLQDTDKFMLAIKLPADKNWFNTSGVAIFKTRKPYNADTIRQLLKGEAPQTLNGKSYYEIKEIAGQQLPPNNVLASRPYVCMPSNQVVILAFVPRSQLEEILPPAGATSKLPASTQQWMRQADKAQAWILSPIEGLIREHFQQLGGQLFAAPPDLVAMIDVMKRAKAVWDTATFLSNDKIRITWTLVCANEADASKITTSFENLWKNDDVKRGFSRASEALEKKRLPGLRALVSEIRDGVEFTFEGTTAQATLDLSESTIETVVKEVVDLKKQGRNPFLGP
jgi:hypothetical protein